MHCIREALFAITVVALSFVATSAAAENVSKDACVDAHSRGQDAKDQGKITLARKLFVSCAQTSCPTLVQNDCARFANDLESVQPSLTFSARDGKGNDLPDTTVFVDDVLIVTRLVDGRPHEVDPGRHVVRFEHGGEEQVVTVVVGSGEKGRPVISTFAEKGGGPFETADEGAPRAQEERVHPLGARLILGVSTTLVVAGATLAIVGLTNVPENCSLSSHQCAAPPGDSSFEDAEKAVRLSNVGWAVTGVGAAALTAGLVWYFRGEKTVSADKQVAPFVTSQGGGIAVSGRM